MADDLTVEGLTRDLAKAPPAPVMVLSPDSPDFTVAAVDDAYRWLIGASR